MLDSDEVMLFSSHAVPTPIGQISTCIQGFQLLGIAWREKHQVRSARTHECGPGPPAIFFSVLRPRIGTSCYRRSSIVA